jgi:hypothetical protein
MRALWQSRDPSAAGVRRIRRVEVPLGILVMLWTPWTRDPLPLPSTRLLYGGRGRPAGCQARTYYQRDSNLDEIGVEVESVVTALQNSGAVTIHRLPWHTPVNAGSSSAFGPTCSPSAPVSVSPQVRSVSAVETQAHSAIPTQAGIQSQNAWSARSVCSRLLRRSCQTRRPVVTATMSSMMLQKPRESPCHIGSECLQEEKQG